MADQKRIPKGKLGRGSVVGFAAARAGVKKAGHLTRRPFLSEEKQVQADQENDAEIARIIFNALCVLRGTALKAAQLIAMEMELVPESFRRELAKASSEVPPMNRALVYKLIKSELGPPEQVFRHFEQRPFAAASLGQVHAATAPDGRELAVKVQYPGIADGVKTDIEMLKTLLAPTKYYRIFDACFDEISRKVGEELDYGSEALHTTAFSEGPALDGIVLPEVVTHLSTRTVLSTSRIEGLHIDAWLATNPSQAERDHYGQLLVDFFHHGTFVRRLIHADPHPGNYLFRKDGRLGVIDFGCVKKLDPDLVADITRLSELCDFSDPKAQEALHNRIGIYYRGDVDKKAFAAFLREWVAWLQEPYREEVFDFARSDDYFRRGALFAKALYSYIDRYDGSFIYYGRTEHGLMRLLQRLGARVRMRPA